MDVSIAFERFTPVLSSVAKFLLSLLGFFYEVWIAPDFVDTSNSDLSEILSSRGGSLWGATDVTTKRDAQNRFKSKFK